MADFTLNLESPLARGLVFWLPMWGRTPHVDRVRGLRLSENGTPVWVSDSKFGQVLEFDDASSEYLELNITPPVTGYPLTMASWFYSDDADLIQHLIWVGDKDDNAQYFALAINGSLGGDPVTAIGSDASSTYANTTSGYSVNTWHHACGVFTNATNRAAFIDGGSKGTNVLSRSPSGIDRVSIGRNGRLAATQYFSGRIWNACIWNRALSDAEVDYAYRHPYDLFRPIQQRVWYIEEVAAGDLSITVSDGVTVGESVTVQFFDPQVIVSDGITVGESVTVLAPSVGEDVDVSDNITVGESVLAYAPRDISVSDGLTVGETVTVSVSDPQVDASDNVTVGDVVTVYTARDISVTDNIVIGEAVTVTVSDPQLSVVDGIVVGETTNVTISGVDLSIAVTFADYNYWIQGVKISG